MPFVHPPIELAGLRPRGRLHPDRRIDFLAICFGTFLHLAPIGRLLQGYQLMFWNTFAAS
jgi:hypothetical protein